MAAALADPEQKRCPTSLHRPRNRSADSEELAVVQRGWSRKRVLEVIGGPTSCDGAVWSYVAGPYSGPETTYRFTFSGSVVARIETSSIGCRYY